MSLISNNPTRLDLRRESCLGFMPLEMLSEGKAAMKGTSSGTKKQDPKWLLLTRSTLDKHVFSEC